MAARARAGVAGGVRAITQELTMLARRIATVVRHVPFVILALQVAALVTGDPGTAASGGGDFPIRRL